ncbi:nascent polypeptide-associated complex subunit alpha [Strigomonas culicis]|uniref:Nascent polypeptide-associated complex subunit alpha n=1 Tax=Strigomonas culicis TaxID=28005 RepID=S9V366_9TRYP|nr:nascent polypeptide-associated complex subunit alpha [Strigomonas culicis]|eukprot:EPY17275.1 nascent polypeptide-associated complex subunit alpha [Strigomonas culicis]
MFTSYYKHTVGTPTAGSARQRPPPLAPAAVLTISACGSSSLSSARESAASCCCSVRRSEAHGRHVAALLREVDAAAARYQLASLQQRVYAALGGGAATPSAASLSTSSSLTDRRGSTGEPRSGGDADAAVLDAPRRAGPKACAPVCAARTAAPAAGPHRTSQSRLTSHSARHRAGVKARVSKAATAQSTPVPTTSSTVPPEARCEDLLVRLLMRCVAFQKEERHHALQQHDFSASSPQTPHSSCCCPAVGVVERLQQRVRCLQSALCLEKLKNERLMHLLTSEESLSVLSHAEGERRGSSRGRRPAADADDSLRGSTDGPDSSMSDAVLARKCSTAAALADLVEAPPPPSLGAAVGAAGSHAAALPSEDDEASPRVSPIPMPALTGGGGGSIQDAPLAPPASDRASTHASVTDPEAAHASDSSANSPWSSPTRCPSPMVSEAPPLPTSGSTEGGARAPSIQTTVEPRVHRPPPPLPSAEKPQVAAPLDAHAPLCPAPQRLALLPPGEEGEEDGDVLFNVVGALDAAAARRPSCSDAPTRGFALGCLQLTKFDDRPPPTPVPPPAPGLSPVSLAAPRPARGDGSMHSLCSSDLRSNSRCRDDSPTPGPATRTRRRARACCTWTARASQR